MQPGQQGYGYGGGPQGYGVPPQNAYGPPPGASALVDGIRSIATPTIALLGARAAIPVLFRLLGFAGIRLGSPMIYEGLRGVTGLVAIILYFIWFSRFYGWVRASTGATSYSTGLAIGGWFIPFANFVYPYLAMNDAYRRASNNQGSPLVALWWLSYIGTIVLSIFTSVSQTAHLLPTDRSAMPLYEAIGWMNSLSQIAAYGLWAMLVKELTAKAR